MRHFVFSEEATKSIAQSLARGIEEGVTMPHEDVDDVENFLLYLFDSKGTINLTIS